MIYEIYHISKKEELITIDYSLTPSADSDACERNKVAKSDTPHEDFSKLWQEAKDLAVRMVELPMINAKGKPVTTTLVKVDFLRHKDLGEGMRMKLQISGLAKSGDDIFIITPAYFESSKYTRPEAEDGYVLLQKLTPEEGELLYELKLEAFNYAYHCKRLQPTAEEAAEAAESGGFKDEKEA